MRLKHEILLLRQSAQCLIQKQKLRLPQPDEDLELAPDGLVASAASSVLLFNSVKHAPSREDVYQLLADAAKLESILSDFPAVSSTPPEAKAQLARLLPSVFGPSARARLRVVPFLSGDNFSARVAAECERLGVGAVRPSGGGFAVKAARRAA